MSPSTGTLSCYGTNLPLRLFYPFLLLFIHHLLSYIILSILLILFVSFIIYALAAPARRSPRFPVDRCQSHVSPPVVPLAQPAVLSPPLRGFGRVVPFALRAFFFASSCCFAPSTGGPRSSAEAPQAITPFLSSMLSGQSVEPHAPLVLHIYLPTAGCTTRAARCPPAGLRTTA